MKATVAEAPEVFQHAVNALAARPAFMAHVLATVFGGDVSAKRISAELRCSETNALRIAMMTTPRSDREHFLNDIASIASAADVDQALLLSLVRKFQVLAAFDSEGAQQGMLLAARDIVPDSDD